MGTKGVARAASGNDCAAVASEQNRTAMVAGWHRAVQGQARIRVDGGVPPRSIAVPESRAENDQAQRAATIRLRVVHLELGVRTCPGSDAVLSHGNAQRNRAGEEDLDVQTKLRRALTFNAWFVGVRIAKRWGDHQRANITVAKQHAVSNQ